MTHYSGRNGNVYIASQLVENCEDAWDEQVDGDVTASLETSDYKVGSGSCKFILAAGIADGDIIASEVVSVALTGYDRLIWWAKSTVAITSAGDLQLLVDEHALCASPLAVNFPTLAAGVWKKCRTAASLTSLSAVISVGAKLTDNDPGALTLYLDEIRAAKVVAGIQSWTLKVSVATKSTTDFGSQGVSEHIPTISEWSGGFKGLKDGVPLAYGSIVAIELAETATATQAWMGDCIITNVQASNSHDGLVTYDYEFQGTNALQVPTT